MINNIPSYKSIEDFFFSNFQLHYKTKEDPSKYFKGRSINFEENLKNIYAIEPVFYQWKGYEFPVFIHDNSKELFVDGSKLNFDVYLNTFLFLSGWLEIVNRKRDSHERFPFAESLQKKYNFITIPVVNIYFELLYEAILKNGKSIDRNRYNEPIVFTHDIDQLRSAWFENIQFYTKNLSLKSLYQIPKNIFVKLFGLKDDYYKGLEKMLALDTKHNIRAVSFLLPKKSHRDADFDLKQSKYKAILDDLQAKQEVGLHPSYESYKHETIFQNDLEFLNQFTKQSISKSRQHFLRFEMLKTPYIIENSLIEEDYTLGFAEHFGFRNGIASPFYLFNFKEQKAFTFSCVPLVFMDVSFLNYSQSKNETQLTSDLLSFLTKTISNFNCKFSVLFHNSVFSQAKYKNYETLYKKIIVLSKK